MKHRIANRAKKALYMLVSFRQRGILSKDKYNASLKHLVYHPSNRGLKTGTDHINALLIKLLNNPMCMTPKRAGSLIYKYIKVLPFDANDVPLIKTQDNRIKIADAIRGTIVRALNDKQSGKIKTTTYNHVMSSLAQSIPPHRFTNLDSVLKLVKRLNENSTCMTPNEANGQLKSLLDPSKWVVVRNNPSSHK